MTYLADAVRDPTSALLVSGERALAAEFPPDSHARHVLAAIGSGERTFSLIARAAGGLPQASLTRALRTLVVKRVITAMTPLSTQPSTNTRYVIADPHLRVLARLPRPTPARDRTRKGRPGRRTDQGLVVLLAGTSDRAGGPGSAAAVAPGRLPEGTGVVGSYWTRTNDPEIDLVGADRAPVAHQITLVGSIKWLEKRPFDSRDLAQLLVHRSRLPGADDTTALLVVSRGGAAIERGIPVLAPDDLLAAYE